MLQSFKKISGIVLLAFGLQTSWAFSLLGPMPSPVDYTPSSLYRQALEIIGRYFNDWL